MSGPAKIFIAENGLTEDTSDGYFYMNSWFDLYDESGEHLDFVEHEIYEALSAAKLWLDGELA